MNETIQGDMNANMLKLITVFLHKLNYKEDEVFELYYSSYSEYSDEELKQRIIFLVTNLLHYLKDPKDLREEEKYYTEELKFFEEILKKISVLIDLKDVKNTDTLKDGRKSNKKKSNKKKSNKKKSNKKKSKRKSTRKIKNKKNKRKTYK